MSQDQTSPTSLSTPKLVINPARHGPSSSEEEVQSYCSRSVSPSRCLSRHSNLSDDFSLKPNNRSNYSNLLSPIGATSAIDPLNASINTHEAPLLSTSSSSIDCDDQPDRNTNSLPSDTTPFITTTATTATHHTINNINIPPSMMSTSATPENDTTDALSDNRGAQSPSSLVYHSPRSHRPNNNTNNFSTNDSNLSMMTSTTGSNNISASVSTSPSTNTITAATTSPFVNFSMATTAPVSPNDTLQPGNCFVSKARRSSVSAECLKPDAEPSRPLFYSNKTPEQIERINHSVKNNFLFRHLDEEQYQNVVSAMTEKQVENANEVIIKQGDEGDFFYVVEKGIFEIYQNHTGSTTTISPQEVQNGKSYGSLVSVVEPGGSFGELALMYNAPRAATVVSAQPNCVLWCLDRLTFRQIILAKAAQKRMMYEALLSEVPILKNLQLYERQKIADALETEQFEENSVIIQQHDKGDRFYIIEAGQAQVLKEGEGVVSTLQKGNYFGELALINDEPRNATIVALTRVKVATLSRNAFIRLLGNAMSIMKSELR